MTANTDPAPEIVQPLSSDHDRLRRSIEKSAELLPIHGPITAFVFLNTLQALEDLPFEQGLLLGANLFGVQPYLTEDRYREKLARGRIRLEDLSIVLRRDLAERADVKLGSLTTPFEIRQAMLQHALQTGPVEELRWFIAETDALTRFRADVPQPVQSRVIDETKRWVMRDLRDGGDDHHRNTAPHGTHDQHLHDDLIRRFGESTIEQWSDATWEAFTLRLLWRVCRDGALHLKSGTTTAAQLPPLRHRDALQRVANRDSDALVNDVLIRFCAAFTDQGMAGWELPVREHGFFRGLQSVGRTTGCVAARTRG